MPEMIVSNDAIPAAGPTLRPIGRTLYAMPPYVLDEADAAHLAHGALAALDETLAESDARRGGSGHEERALP